MNSALGATIVITQRISLREDSSAVHLTAYLLDNSPEFQTDQRRPAVIVCPGGGYLFTSDREAEPIALRFLARGYHAFVLRYTVGARFPAPMLDLARAILTVRQRAEEWLVDPDQIAVCGFSAGGHLAASLGVLWDKPLLYGALGVRAEQIRPNALILGYPVIDLDLVANLLVETNVPDTQTGIKDQMFSAVFGAPDAPEELKAQYRLDRHVSAATPPSFIWHTDDDELVFAHNALRFATALADQRVPHELHIFQGGVHGLALADETTEVEGKFLSPHSQVWVDLALDWLRRQRG
jgi:acetyl esterase/lipase